MRARASCALVLALAAPLCAQELPAVESIDRVRAALQRPPSKLVLQQRTPDFSVHIEKRRPMQDIFDIPPWQLQPGGWQPPAWSTVNLLSLAGYVAHQIAEVKRGHDQRLAREEVQRTIQEYCAAQENRAEIQICSTSLAVR